MKQQMTALANAHNTSMTELIARALDAYASPDNSKHVDFGPNHHHILKGISKILSITLPGAVEYALEHGIVPFARGAVFFQHRIEVWPEARLASVDMWASFQDWQRSRGMRGWISEDEFYAICFRICSIKAIVVRARGNQVFCLDVRLRARDQLATPAA